MVSEPREARAVIESWRHRYNAAHQSLGYLTPFEFKQHHRAADNQPRGISGNDWLEESRLKPWQDRCCSPGTDGMKQGRCTFHLVVFGISVIAFGAIALSVIATEPAGTLDRAALAWAHTHAAPWLTDVMLKLTFSGGPSATSVYALILVAVFLWGRRLRTAAAIAGIVYGGMLLNVVVKHAFGRARPTVEHPVITLVTFSFPSGHAAAATIFGGLLCVLAVRWTDRQAHKVIAPSVAILWIVAVCASRVYLGLHYLTDVVGGIAEGIAWLALSTLLLQRTTLRASKGLTGPKPNDART